MKTILFTNQKGGVGKSAVATQIAYYFAEKLGLRTLAIDLDHQCNLTKPLVKSGLAIVSKPASEYMLDRSLPLPSGQLVLLPGDDGLTRLEKQPAMHNDMAQNLRHLLTRANEQFDVCVIDTNPNVDIRMTAALYVADFLLSPVQMNQEAIDGIGALIRDYKNIKARANPKLQLIGLLPNLLTPTPFQKANFAEIATKFGSLLMKLEKGGYAHLKQRTAVAEAQAAGQPIYKSNQTSAKDAWKEWEEVFAHIAKTAGVL